MNSDANGLSKCDIDNLGIVLEKFRKDNIDCNIKILGSNGNYVNAHRIVLMARSTFFHIHLADIFRKEQNKSHVITLPFSIEFEVIDNVIAFIYTNSLKYLDGLDYTKVQKLFELFQVNDIEIIESSFKKRLKEQGIGCSKSSDTRVKQEFPSCEILNFDENLDFGSYVQDEIVLEIQPNIFSDHLNHIFIEDMKVSPDLVEKNVENDLIVARELELEESNLNLQSWDDAFLEEDEYEQDDAILRDRLTNDSKISEVKNKNKSFKQITLTNSLSNIKKIPNKSDSKLNMKSSAKRIINGSLIPFLGKISELINPVSETLKIAQSSQHIITLWHADILITKYFHQKDLTKHFSKLCLVSLVDKNHEQLGTAAPSLQQKAKSKINLKFESSNYDVECFDIGIADSVNTYNKSVILDLDKPIGRDHQNWFNSEYICNFAHMISLYKYNISIKVIGKRDSSNIVKEAKDADNCKQNSLVQSPTYESSQCNDQKIYSNDNNDSNCSLANKNKDSEDFGSILDKNSRNREEINSKIIKSIFDEEKISLTPFQEFYSDLKRRLTTDIELRANIDTNQREELILHIILDQLDEKYLTITIGVFLAKSCNFCQKKNCTMADLNLPLISSNPLCPDKLCIRNKLTCDICRKTMHTSKTMNRHKEVVHNILLNANSHSHICAYCGVKFSKQWMLNVHEKEHRDKQVVLVCNICDKKFNGRVLLKKHILMVHETVPKFCCEVCQKCFKRKESLAVHKRIHYRDKPFKCVHCCYASETKGNLKAHVLRMHTKK